jgi:4-oxalocrotonate tautomerase
MPFVNIRLVKELIADDPAGKKAAIAKRVSAAITETTGLTDNDVWIVFEEIGARDWTIGPSTVESLRFNGKAKAGAKAKK